MPTIKPKNISEDVIIPPFTIEADHPRNSDLFIQVIPDCRLRSAIKPTKEVFAKNEYGEQEEVPANAKLIEGLPRSLPGMQITVNPQKGTFTITDPIEDDERALNRIKTSIERNGGYRTNKIFKGVPKKEGTLDKDEMKTLVRELVSIVENGQAKKVKGEIPDLDEVNELPGDYLLNASNAGNYNQPRYEKDLDEWKRRIVMLKDD